MILSISRLIVVLAPLSYSTYVTTRRVFLAIILKYIIIITFIAVCNKFWMIAFVETVHTCLVSFGSFGANSVPYKNIVPYMILMGTVCILILSLVVMIKLKMLTMKNVSKIRNRHVIATAIELLLLVGVFTICTASITIFAFLAIFKVLAKTNLTFTIAFAYIAKFLFYLQPVLNPLVYVLRRADYKDEIIKKIGQIRTSESQGCVQISPMSSNNPRPVTIKNNSRSMLPTMAPGVGAAKITTRQASRNADSGAKVSSKTSLDEFRH